MHIITAYQTAVTLFGRDGSAVAFKSIAKARQELGLAWIRKNVGRHFTEFSHTSNLGDKIFERRPVYIEYQYIMRDDWGDPVVFDDFKTSKERTRLLGYRAYWHHPTWNGEGPVPGLYRFSGYHYFRHPRTMQERRLAIPMEPEIEPLQRARRNHHNLPTSYDDLKNFSRSDRNWKRFRKTRWLETG